MKLRLYDRICLELDLTREQFLAYREYREREVWKRLWLERLSSVMNVNPRVGAGQWAAKFKLGEIAC